MPNSLSKIIGIDPTELTDRGAFDPVLDLDTRLFLDPHLLKHCDIPEFSNSYKLLQDHFIKIGKLLKVSESYGDVFWRKADSLMKWPEVKGLCIGYSSKGTSGSGIGPELCARLLKTAQAVIRIGKDDPEFFELIGLFEENFGPDRISDMTANVIFNDLKTFTNNIINDLDIDIYDFLKRDNNSGLPINPFTEKTLLLVPKELLRDLPVALDWDDLDYISIQNQELRDRINAMVGDSWRKIINNKICQQFKTLIEDNGLSTLLYNRDKSLKPESAAQLLFYGVCESYCDANGIMIARESDSGRGPVDFKFGTRKENSVLVEIKKSTNTSGLKKGIEKQLPQYMRSEKSKRAIYLVIDVGFTKAATDNLAKIKKQIHDAAIKILHVDGSIKNSASKL